MLIQVYYVQMQIVRVHAQPEVHGWTQLMKGARGYAYTRVAGFSRKGPTSLRFEVRSGDCFTAYPDRPSSGWDDCTRHRERAEVREKWTAMWNRPVWYAISIYIPRNYEFL